MAETQLTLGTEVRCTDGACGRLHRIIVGPGGPGAGATLTHLAVGPDGLSDGRLVPARLIAGVDEHILLGCGIAEFGELEPATETAPEYTASWPYPEQGPGGRFPFGVEGIERDTGYGNRTTTRDRIPPGGAEIRRGEPVYAVDGQVGRIRGLFVDLRDRRVTRLLVESGHLGGHHARIAVPAASVRTFADGVRLGLSREEVHHHPVQEEGT